MEVIAFYLPQYHPTAHNNEWWGEGFTEWTNVAKAKPLFPGHYQPKIPADLGFYDLRMPEVREKQVQLAKEAGITAFCYYHYWFGNGHKELEYPFEDVVKRGEPDFPFCLCWANESWYKKFWNKDGNVSEKQDLVIQKYLGEKDNKYHFEDLLSAFKDPRYLKIDDRLVFMIYKPLEFEDVCGLIKQWNGLAKANGLKGFYFIGYSLSVDIEYETIKNLGFDAVCSCRLANRQKLNWGWKFRRILSILTKIPIIISYKDMVPKLFQTFEESHHDVFPTLLPNWDHTPRSGSNGYLYSNSTPELFEKHADIVFANIKNRPEDKRIVFLKSWNEWGEGNYMEPDLKYGKGYINSLYRSIVKNMNK